MSSGKVTPLHEEDMDQKDQKRSKSRGFSKLILNLLKGFKYCFASILLIIFIVEVYGAIGRLDDQTTITSSAKQEQYFTYPSITICVTMDSNFTGGPFNKDWQPMENYNLTFPFKQLGYISDNGEK